MSEHQYYEFLTLDRPLTSSELDEVRQLSTRARITPTSFANEYHWGNFRGDTDRMVELYYDAHLYFASWGTRQVTLRLPEDLLPAEAVKPYCSDQSLRVRTYGGHTILDFCYEAEDGEDWDESAETPLSVVAGVRAELAAGDHRALYLAWLVGLARWELEDADEEEYQSEHEPPVPAGLAELTGAQRALADFLRLDTDLLAAAAAGSALPTEAGPQTGEALASWVEELPVAEKDALLLRAARGQAPQLGQELLARHRAEATTPGHSPAALYGEGRTAAQLLDEAADRRFTRQRRAAEKHTAG